MMIIFKQSQEKSVSVLLDSGGTPVTGLVASDVTCALSKDGATPVTYDLTVGSRFTEVDATELPGVYHISLEASVLDTLGEIYVRFYDDGTSSSPFDSSVVQGFVNTEDLTGIATSVDNVDTNVSNNGATLADMQGVSFSTSTDSLEALRDVVDTRAPEEVALKKHLGNGTGLIDAPTDVGIWDVLGDGTVSLVDVSLDLKRTLGLTQENYKITDQTYDGNDNLVSAIIRIYPTSTDLQNDTNILATYVMSSTYDSQNRLIDYQVEKQ